MSIIQSPPERANPNPITNAVYVSKDTRLLLRIYNWRSALGYLLVVRYLDKSGTERYIRQMGATSDTNYVTNIYVELEEGWLIGVNLYATYVPGANYWPFFALIALTHGRTPVEELSTTLAYGIAGYSVPLSWPNMQFHDFEDYVEFYVLQQDDVAGTQWVLNPYIDMRVRYIYANVKLGSGTGNRVVTITGTYGAWNTFGASFTITGSNTEIHIIIEPELEAGIIGNTVYVRAPNLKHLRAGEQLKIGLSNVSTGDQIQYVTYRYIYLPGR